MCKKLKLPLIDDYMLIQIEWPGKLVPLGAHERLQRVKKAKKNL